MTNDERMCPRGSVWADSDGDARVMATTEGYAVMRRQGGIPFIRTVREVCVSGKWRLVSWSKRPKACPLDAILEAKA